MIKKIQYLIFPALILLVALSVYLLDKDINKSNIRSIYFYYVLMTHTEMYNKEKKKGWFPGHVFIIEKSNFRRISET